MIAPAQDKNKYVETISGKIKALPTFSPVLPDLNQTGDTHKFRYKFVSQQIKDAKSKIKESQNPRSFMQLGDVYLIQGNSKRALEHFLMALELDPNFLALYEKIILAYLLQGDSVKADEYYLKLIRLSDRQTDILHKYALFKAFMDQSNKDPEEAIHVLNEILEKEPQNFEVINSLGFVILNAQNKVDEAKKYFKRALDINPTFVHSLNNLGVCAIRQENFTEAEKYFSAAMDAVGNYVGAYENLACSYIMQKKHEQAYEILKKAKYKQLKLDDLWDHKIGWLLIELKRIPEAVEWYRSKIIQESKNDLLYNNLGVCYRILGKIDEAERNFLKAVNLFIERKQRVALYDQLKSFYNLARVAIDKGNLDLLGKVVDNLLRIKPKDPFGLYLQGTYHSLSEDYVKAKEYYEEALSINRQIPELYPDYAFVLEAIEKKYDEAEAVLKEALSYGYRSPNIDNNLAFVYILKNEYKKAEEILSKYVDHVPSVILATKGFWEFRKGNFEKGDTYYEKACKEFKGKTAKICKQIWFNERANYFIGRGDIEKAEDELRNAKEFPDSYVSSDIIETQEKISQVKFKLKNS